MSKKLIINADDFGMSSEVNKGVKEGINKGVITSVSVMANMPYFDDAIRFLKKNKEISVGLHFNITEGNPILLPRDVGTLLREDNTFYYWPSFIARTLFRNINFSEVKKELKAQYDKLQSSGIKITHLDSHHHVHLYPELFDIVSDFADKYKISSLRGNYFSTWNLTLGIRKKPIPTQLIVNAFLVLINIINSDHTHLYEINRFYDINWGKDIKIDRFIKILENLPDGTTEFICHLAVVSKTGNPNFLEPRQNALTLLTKPQVINMLTKNGIELVQHRHL